MSLASGSRLGPYEIVAALGVGGMGEVYRARDTQLKREIALKVLPAEVAADSDRLARFQREAQVLAALNHPHIAQIHGLVEADPSTGSGQGGVRAPLDAARDAMSGNRMALVMELVEGPTLAERIARGPVPLDEALPIALQLAEALEYAHERGIVHRDLKPANIKLTSEGAVKVLDFGLAKALAADAAGATADPLGNSPTLASPADTRAGVILGTAAYMAPEQARGTAVDKRADIWAFGVVLFEMLTGRPCFGGETVTDVLAAVVKTEPKWTALPADTPAPVRQLLHRCLAKDRRQRLHDIADARLEVEAAQTPLGGVGLGSASNLDARPAAVAGFWSGRRVVSFGLLPLAALVLALGAALYWSVARSAAPGVVNHVDLALPEGHALYSSPAISPDGRTVAFVSAGQNEHPSLYVRELTKDFALRPIAGTEDADSPFFSPDGRSIAFFARGQLLRISLDGGSPVPIAPAPAPLGGTWGDDESIVFTPTLNRGLVRVDLSGRPPQTLIRPDGGATYAFTYPSFLPGARELLFSAWGMNVNVERMTLADGKRVPVVAMFASNALYAGSGHVLFGSLLSIFRSELLAVALSPPDADGGATPVLSGVFVDTRAGRFWADLSRTGTLVYAAGDVRRTALVRVDKTGRVLERYPGEGHYETPAVSPDGEHVAYTRDGRIRVRSLKRGDDALLTEETGAASRFTERTPTWHPDGVHILYMSNRRGNWDLYMKNASGAGMAHPVVEKRGDQLFPSMRHDGTLLFVESDPERGRDIWLQTLDGKPKEWLATSKNEYWPTFSPDGTLIAYASDQSERFEVYVSPVTDPSTRHQISTEGGVYPVWSPKGGCVFFREGTRFLAADVHPDGTPAGKPRLLFDGGWPLGTSAGLPLGRTSVNPNGLAVMPAGEQFLMIRAAPEAIPTRLHIVFNWLEELKSRVATKK